MCIYALLYGAAVSSCTVVMAIALVQHMIPVSVPCNQFTGVIQLLFCRRCFSLNRQHLQIIELRVIKTTGQCDTAAHGGMIVIHQFCCLFSVYIGCQHIFIRR